MAENKFEKQRQKDKAKFEKERAKWQKKDAKARSRKKPKLDVTRIVITTLAVLVVGALVIAAGGSFLLTYGMPARWMPALSVAGTTIRQPEYTVFLNHEFQRHHAPARQAYALNQQFAAMGLSVGDHMGLDPWASPFGQPMLQPERQVAQLNSYGEPLVDAEGNIIFDTVRDPMLDDDGNPMMWEDFLIANTNRSFQNLIIQYNEARRLGLELSEEQLADVERIIEAERNRAHNNPHDPHAPPRSLNTWLRLNNAPGYTERVMRRAIVREFMAENFAEYQEQVLADNISDEEVREFYEDDTSLFDFVDLRILPFVVVQPTVVEDETPEDFVARQEQAIETARQQAAAFLATVGDEASFIAAAQAVLDAEAGDDEDALDATESTEYVRQRRHNLEQNLDYTLAGDEDETTLADWLFDSARQTGNTAVFEDHNTFYAVMLVREPYTLYAVDFLRLHLPVVPAQPEPPEDEDELEDWDAAAALAAAQAQALEEALEQAAAMLTQFEENGADANAFHALGVAATLTGALPGSASFTELNISPVQPWLFEQGRQMGNTTIIPLTNEAGVVTELLIVFLSATHDDSPSWLVEGRQILTFEAFEDHVLALHEQYPMQERRLGMWFVRRTVEPMMEWYIMVRRFEMESEAAGQGSIL